MGLAQIICAATSGNQCGSRTAAGQPAQVALLCLFKCPRHILSREETARPTKHYRLLKPPCVKAGDGFIGAKHHAEGATGPKYPTQFVDRARWIFQCFAPAQLAAAFVVFATVFLLWSARITSDIWIQRTGLQPSESTFSPTEIALAARVKSEMDSGLWREEKLTIGTLANRLDTQEHRLRRTINRVMGHRNFAAFINGYRIEAARQELADPDKAEKAILNIAYDVGFASLGPFNRAFRLATGQPPSGYRKRALRDQSNR